MHLALARTCNTPVSVAGESGGQKKTNSKTKQCANATKNPVRNTGQLEGGWQPVLVGNQPVLVQIRPVRRLVCKAVGFLTLFLSSSLSCLSADIHSLWESVTFMFSGGLTPTYLITL